MTLYYNSDYISLKAIEISSVTCYVPKYSVLVFRDNDDPENNTIYTMSKRKHKKKTINSITLASLHVILIERGYNTVEYNEITKKKCSYKRVMRKLIKNIVNTEIMDKLEGFLAQKDMDMKYAMPMVISTGGKTYILISDYHLIRTWLALSLPDIPKFIENSMTDAVKYISWEDILILSIYNIMETVRPELEPIIFFNRALMKLLRDKGGSVVDEYNVLDKPSPTRRSKKQINKDIKKNLK